MKSYVLIVAVIVSLTLLLVVWACGPLVPPEEPVARGVGAPKVPYTACLEEDGDIVVDSAYLLVDLSDSTNWPHTNTNEVIIKGVYLQGRVSGNHEWKANVGVVTENDGTDGSADFVHHVSLIALSGMFESAKAWPDYGLNLRVTSDELVYAGTNIKDDAAARWGNTNYITATMATSGTVAAGDVVLFMDEVGDGSNVNFAVCVDYDTE